MKILDCTLRDGGHLNNWLFDIDFAKELYLSALNTGINYFEVGYKTSAEMNNLGKFAHCDDEFLNSIFIKNNDCKITVMAQHGKFSVNDFVSVESGTTPISAVRVATYPITIKDAFFECIELKNKGYEVFFNLMAASRFQNEHYQILEDLPDKNLIDYIVFSDSFGSMLPNDVTQITKNLTEIGFNNIGFHSHNNQQLAFANSISAIDAGCSIVDATVSSIGRGAGNLSMEVLLCYLNRLDFNICPKYYFDFIDKFLPAKRDTVFNLIAGHFNLHSKYVSEFVSQNNPTLNELYSFIEKISTNSPVHFDHSYIV